MPLSPTIALNDGHHIPRLGFGVWRLPDEDAPGVVGGAIKAGNRHIDTAQGYNNEEGVGRAVCGSPVGWGWEQDPTPTGSQQLIHQEC